MAHEAVLAAMQVIQNQLEARQGLAAENLIDSTLSHLACWLTG